MRTSKSHKRIDLQANSPTETALYDVSKPKDWAMCIVEPEDQCLELQQRPRFFHKSHQCEQVTIWEHIHQIFIGWQDQKHSPDAFNEKWQQFENAAKL